MSRDKTGATDNNVQKGFFLAEYKPLQHMAAV